MRLRPVFRLQALFLVALLGALTGLPSHHHERRDVGPILQDAGHHGHGVQLVDTSDRLTSELIVAALPAARTVVVSENVPVLTLEIVSASRPVAGGRPPPSVRPRAPPVSV